MITIDEQEYAHLLRANYILESLYAGGVDNWINYYDALNDTDSGFKSAIEIQDMSDEEVINYITNNYN